MSSVDAVSGQYYLQLCQVCIVLHLPQGVEECPQSHSHLYTNDGPLCNLPKEQCGNYTGSQLERGGKVGGVFTDIILVLAYIHVFYKLLPWKLVYCFECLCTYPLPFLIPICIYTTDSKCTLKQKIRAAEAYVKRAMCERSYYRTAVKDSQDAVKQHFTSDGVPTLPAPGSAPPSGSGRDTIHYAFDFAQQVHYPHNPLQPRPMYFKTAIKCAVFGVCFP